MAIIVVISLLAVVGCASAPKSEESASPVTALTPAVAATRPRPTTGPTGPTNAERRIEADRQTATALIEANGGCTELSTERCVANMLAFLLPESPALGPATEAAAREERELRNYANAVAEAEQHQKTLDYAAAVETARQDEERRILEYAAAIEAAEVAEAEQYRRTLAYAAAVEAAKAKEREAIRIGDSLLARYCPNGGEYLYWTDPPRAEVTLCYAPQSSSGNGQRTGAICNDGWRSSATGRGACSSHGGVNYWLY